MSDFEYRPGRLVRFLEWCDGPDAPGVRVAKRIGEARHMRKNGLAPPQKVEVWEKAQPNLRANLGYVALLPVTQNLSKDELSKVKEAIFTGMEVGENTGIVIGNIPSENQSIHERFIVNTVAKGLVHVLGGLRTAENESGAYRCSESSTFRKRNLVDLSNVIKKQEKACITAPLAHIFVIPAEDALLYHASPGTEHVGRLQVLERAQPAPFDISWCVV